VPRELDQEAREGQLVERLREIYRSQGIEVTDRVLIDGVRSLAAARFVYTPPPPGLARSLALVWIDRGRILRQAGTVALVVALGWGAYSYFWVGASERAAAQARIEITQTLPAALAKAKRTALDESVVADAKAKATAVGARGDAAIARKDAPATKTAIADLDALTATLRETYQLRIVTRKDVRSGVWRQHPRSPGVRNYYLVVEAIGPDGRALERSITSEEDQTTSKVSLWGQRVPQATYDQVARDKQDDQIIQNTRLGEKRRGELDVRWSMPVMTGAITKW